MRPFHHEIEFKLPSNSNELPVNDWEGCNQSTIAAQDLSVTMQEPLSEFGERLPAALDAIPDTGVITPLTETHLAKDIADSSLVKTDLGQIVLSGQLIEAHRELEAQPIVEEVLLTPEYKKETLDRLQKEVGRPFNFGPVLPTMFALAEKLNPQLEQYDLVVGDDTSGRLPALIYWRLINARRQEKGLSPAAMRFMRGKYGDDYEKDIWSILPLAIGAVKRIFGDDETSGVFPVESDHDAKTLIVTEYVKTGSGVNTIYKTVGRQRNALNVDIATLGADEYLKPDKLNCPRFYSVDRMGPEDIDKYLHKKTQDATDAKGIEGISSLHSSRARHFNAGEVRRARADVRLIAKTIYDLLPSVKSEYR